jgi:hypothetical protein
MESISWDAQGKHHPGQDTVSVPGDGFHGLGFLGCAARNRVPAIGARWQADAVPELAPRVLTEQDDRWVLPFNGLTVTQIQVDFAFGLTFDDVGTVRIGSRATLVWDRANGAAAVDMDPGRQDVAAGLALFNSEVLSAHAFKSGGLRIVFVGGRLLRVDPDPRYEAWTATGPGGMLVVSLPGGELAVWPSRP